MNGAGHSNTTQEVGPSASSIVTVDYTVVPDPMGFCYRLCSRVRESKEPIKQVIAEFVSQTHAEYICDALNQERLPGRYSGGNV